MLQTLQDKCDFPYTFNGWFETWQVSDDLFPKRVLIQFGLVNDPCQFFVTVQDGEMGCGFREFTPRRHETGPEKVPSPLRKYQVP